MRVFRGRKKKLTIAFWFYQRGQPGWKCDACREAGLEQSRRCGFLGFEPHTDGGPVWSRGGLLLGACPKPIITAKSMAMLNAFVLWKQTGCPLNWACPAKTVDAFQHLERLMSVTRSTEARPAPQDEHSNGL